MAFDGITVAALVAQLKSILNDGRIGKVAQPEKDELLLTVKGADGQYRLVLSANPTLPLVYLTDENKPSPAMAPSFTMLLRKHLQNGRIVSVYQPDFERVIVMEVEHLDEMGDLCRKRLITELMGKYSNIILTDEDDNILDSIRHVNASVSSVREVLPGLKYFIPRQAGHTDPLKADEALLEGILAGVTDSDEAALRLQKSFTGISSYMAHEISNMAGSVTDRGDEALAKRITRAFLEVMDRVKNGDFTPQILYENGIPSEYAMVPVVTYAAKDIRVCDDPSSLIRTYYREKEQISRSRQKTADLRAVIKTILERDVKKYDLQLKQLRDTDKMDKYRVYGELLHTYGYNARDGAKSITVDNYYTGEKLTIPLDETKSAMDNAEAYFDRYNKLKRTREALTELTISVKGEIDHLESILSALDFASDEEDLNEIKRELIESGYIRGRNMPTGQSSKRRNVSRQNGNKKAGQAGSHSTRLKSSPLHYISSDGFHMYVGKNNYQNDELTFKVADGGDWWFHAKGMPGSHVIVKTEGKELPDETFEEAARLAAHYSKGAASGKVEIDYLRRKDVKKPGGAKPGFVVYYTNYSMTMDSDISGIEQIP